VNLSQHNTKIIISGGGTGGHIYPALAVANALKEMDPTIEILFVGAEGRMEMEKVPAAGYPIEGLWISGLQRKLTLDNLSFPFKVLSSLRKASTIIDAFKPDAVAGFGGYASGPLLFMASRKKIPALIQEQNSFPGITNKILSKKVSTICVAYENMQKFFPAEKIILTGNPVRQDIIDLAGKKSEASAFFGIDENKKTLLVIGGSLGARTLNESVIQALHTLKSEGIQLIWQTGKYFYPKAKEACKGYEMHGIQAHEFINRMDFAYAAADAVISRAGAISVSEICLAKKPTILVPSPNVAEDHQTKNAQVLANKNAALMISDVEAREHLMTSMIKLIHDENKKSELIRNISPLGMANSAKDIAKEILKLAANKN